MMKDNTSPEERLLRLIRREHKKPSTKQERVDKNPEASEAEETKHYGTAKIRSTVNIFNRIQIAVLAIVAIYLAADVIINTPEKIEKNVLTLEVDKETDIEIPIEASSFSVQPISYYQEPVGIRNIFTASAPEIKAAPPSPTLMEEISKLKLKGIISGNNPKAIIEDMRTKQVYFLSPGEYIGEIRLEEILQGKVKLNYYGQEAELSL